MGFPENILTKDEEVVLDLHPHWLTVLVPILSGLLTIAVAAVIVWLTPVDPTWDIIDWVIIGIGILVLIWVTVVPILRWRTTRYVITNRRVVVRRGVIAKSGQDIALSKITDVSFRQSLLDRIIRSGSLDIETAGDSDNQDFKNIPRSNHVQQLLNRLIEDDVASRGGMAFHGHQMMAGRSQHERPDSVPPPTAEQPPAGGPRDGAGPPDGAGPTGAQQPPTFGQDPGPADRWETPPPR